ncbi:hypothetical protein C8R43DRAFT_965611 [Mycena crocata]|nr:hypothetical protein C8R43DRAFT_965611 [Mycena crocata]
MLVPPTISAFEAEALLNCFGGLLSKPTFTTQRLMLSASRDHYSYGSPTSRFLRSSVFRPLFSQSRANWLHCLLSMIIFAVLLGTADARPYLAVDDRLQRDADPACTYIATVSCTHEMRGTTRMALGPCFAVHVNARHSFTTHLYLPRVIWLLLVKHTYGVWPRSAQIGVVENPEIRLGYKNRLCPPGFSSTAGVSLARAFDDAVTVMCEDLRLRKASSSPVFLAAVRKIYCRGETADMGRTRFTSGVGGNVCSGVFRSAPEPTFSRLGSAYRRLSVRQQTNPVATSAMVTKRGLAGSTSTSLSRRDPQCSEVAGAGSTVCKQKRGAFGSGAVGHLRGQGTPNWGPSQRPDSW